MPDAVKTACDSRYRGEEGVSHPYSQHGVFLSEGLGRAYGVVVFHASLSADEKLQQTAEKRYEGKTGLGEEADVAVNYRSGRYGYRKDQSHGPQVEGQVGVFPQYLDQSGEEMPSEYRGDERQEQQGKDLSENEQERVERRQVGMRVYKRHEGGYEHCGRKVYQYDIGCKVCGLSAELLGYHCRGRCRGADEAYHRTFEHYSCLIAGEDYEQGRYGHEAEGLEGKQYQMPAAQVHVAYVHLAEGKEKHEEYEHGLYYGYGSVRKLVCAVQKGYVDVNEIGNDAKDHRNGEGPIPDESYHVLCCLFEIIAFQQFVQGLVVAHHPHHVVAFELDVRRRVWDGNVVPFYSHHYAVGLLVQLCVIEAFAYP